MVLWPFAYNDADELVSAETATGGFDYRCSGEGCEARVRRRAGEHYVPHFYHAIETAERNGHCSSGEGARHAFVKRLVAAYVLADDYRWLEAQSLCHRGHAFRPSLGRIVSVYMEHASKGVRPDLMVVNERAATIAIEIVDTHDYDRERHATLFEGVLRVGVSDRWVPSTITWTSHGAECPICLAERGLVPGAARCAKGHRWSLAEGRLPLTREVIHREIGELSEGCPICARRKEDISLGDARCHWCARASLRLIYHWEERLCLDCVTGNFEGCSAWIGKNGPVVVRGT